MEIFQDKCSRKAVHICYVIESIYSARNFMKSLIFCRGTRLSSKVSPGNYDIVVKPKNSTDGFSTENSLDLEALKIPKSDSSGNAIIGYLNINSFQNQLIDLREVLEHVLLIQFVLNETKWNNSYCCAKFQVFN